jgi:serine/threonine protein kinase
MDCFESRSEDALPPGTRAGPWVVEYELGRGGMGTVYAAVHEVIGKRAAIKVMHRFLLSPEREPACWFLEAKVVNQIGHPNIVDIFETGILRDGRPYLVMERLDGHPLSELAEHTKLLPDLVIEILLQICNAVSAAHAAGVIHRDLKLDNVFVTEAADQPGGVRIKLLDWGIAKVPGEYDIRQSAEGQLVGTPRYLSPEQASGNDVTPKADVYSLGVMAYELFVEQLPFDAETAAEVMMMHLRSTPSPPSELWPFIPPQLETLLLSMLAKSPADRPTMAEVMHRLEETRAELARRRRTLGSGARPVFPPSLRRRNRVVSPVELAGTIPPAYQPAGTRWQYTVGVVALAASALMFVASRFDERHAEMTIAPIDEPAVDGSEPTSAIAPAAVANVASVAAPIDRGTRSGAPETKRARAAAPHRLSASRRSVGPRRAPSIDPDGTIDPYP